MTDYGGALGRAWKYATNLRRLSAMSAFFIIAFAIAVSPILFVYKTVTLGTFNLVTLVQFFAWFFVGVIIALLVLFYAILTFTHNYANQKSLRKSASFAFSNYPRFLAVVIVSGIITFILSSVPFIGFILTIVGALIFFFINQEIGVNKSRFFDALRNSYHIFADNKLEVLITFIVVSVLTVFIVLIFAIPLIVAGILGIASTVGSGTPFALTQMVMANLGAFLVSGLVLLVGIAFSTLFSEGIKTDIYMQLKKKRK